MLQQLKYVVSNYLNPWVIWKNFIWRKFAKVSDLEVVFIVGAPRSGTTLLQRCISIHSDFISVQAESGIFTNQNIFDANRHHFGFSVETVSELLRESSDIVDFFERGSLELISIEKGSKFVEKTPQHILKLGFILEHFPKAKVIHIVRDGRDCFCSSLSNEWVPQNKSVNKFAAYWKKCLMKAMRYEGDERVYNLKYEDLVKSPKIALKDVMTFLGAVFEESQIDNVKIGADARAEQVEFKKLNEEIGSFSVDRWRSELSVKQKREFIRIASYQLEYFGYPPE